jgi:hypothetical protein
MFDVYIVEGDTLMVGRPNGILDFATAVKIVEFIEIKENQLENGFNRYCDLTRLDSINLSSSEVTELAKRRRLFNPNELKVKSAFLAIRPLAFGIARMYELLLNSPRIEVQVFGQLEAAAEWLGVNPGRLTL